MVTQEPQNACPGYPPPPIRRSSVTSAPCKRSVLVSCQGIGTWWFRDLHLAREHVNVTRHIGAECLDVDHPPWESRSAARAVPARTSSDIGYVVVVMVASNLYVEVNANPVLEAEPKAVSVPESPCECELSRTKMSGVGINGEHQVYCPSTI